MQPAGSVTAVDTLSAMLLEIEGLLKCTEFESGDEAEAVVLTSKAPLTLQETL